MLCWFLLVFLSDQPLLVMFFFLNLMGSNPKVYVRAFEPMNLLAQQQLWLKMTISRQTQSRYHDIPSA